MPEGHSVHRLARDHTAALAGQPLAVSSPQGRFADGAGAVDGAVLERADAHGKHLFYDFAPGATVHVHLGMRGIYLTHPSPPFPEPKKGVRLRLAATSCAVDLIAPSTCELLDADGRARVTGPLGPDPLRADGSRAEAVRRLRAAGGSVGAALLDQSVLAGPGNVFRAEVLYLLRLDPRRPAAGLTDDEAGAVWDELGRLMRRAVDDGRIVTVEAPDRLAVPEADSRWVYKQEVCRGCGAPVRSWSVEGRTVYACPAEQLTAA